MKTTNRIWWRRWKLKLAILGGGGVLLAGSDLSCASLGLTNGLASTNFCFLLNCNDGALGGLIDFCAPTTFRSFVGGVQDEQTTPFLADCPQL